MSPNTGSAVSSRLRLNLNFLTVAFFACLIFVPAASAQTIAKAVAFTRTAANTPVKIGTYRDTNFAHPMARLISTTEHVDMPRPFRPRVVMLDTNHTVAPPPMPEAGASAQEQRVLQLINQERASKGLQPLVWDATLSRAARMHSENMANRGFFNHVAPDGSTASTRIKQCGMHGWSALGENIAFNQGFEDPVAFAVEQWLKSPMHRQNMLSPMWSSSAVGIATAPDGRIFFTELFLAR